MKKDNLLVGNGINLTVSDYFKTNQIAIRIKKMFPIAFDFFEFQYNVTFLKDLEEFFDFDNYSKGLEDLLYDCFKLIVEKRKQDYFNKLTKDKFYELLTLLKKLFINALFIEDNNLIKLEIPQSIIQEVKSYKNVFSLNYYEFWDEDKVTNHLHGKIHYQPFNRDDFGIDDKKMSTDIDYAFTIDQMLTSYYYFPINNLDELIILPLKYNIDKKQVLDFQQEYQVNGFIIHKRFEEVKKKKLYSELENLSSISIFGVSPFGDEYLMNILSKIREVTIYIYDLYNNFTEIEAWKKRVSHAIFKDSISFGSEYYD